MFVKVRNIRKSFEMMNFFEKFALRVSVLRLKMKLEFF